jgi:hypothetical protein
MRNKNEGSVIILPHFVTRSILLIDDRSPDSVRKARTSPAYNRASNDYVPIIFFLSSGRMS